MRPSIALKSLPCLLALISAGTGASPDRTSARFYFEIDEMIFGQDVVLHWHFNDQNRRDFTFFLYITNANQSEMYYTYTHVYRLGTYVGPLNMQHRLEASYFNEKAFHLMFGVQSLNRFDDWKDTVYFHGTLGDPKYVYDIEESRTIDTQRQWAYSTLSGTRFSKFFYNVSKDGKKEGSNTLGLEQWRINRRDADDNYFPITIGKAQLRLLDHLDSWGIGTRIGGNYGYLAVPLKMIKDPNSEDYYFRTSLTYYVDRSTGAMRRTKGDGHPDSCAETNLIHINNTSKKINESFHYQIVLEDVNEIDQFMFIGEYNPNRPHFGNCNQADYCVVIGEE